MFVREIVLKYMYIATYNTYAAMYSQDNYNLLCATASSSTLTLMCRLLLLNIRHGLAYPFLYISVRMNSKFCSLMNRAAGKQYKHETQQASPFTLVKVTGAITHIVFALEIRCKQTVCLTV